MRNFLRLCVIGTVTAVTALSAIVAQSQDEKKKKDRVFELRIYTPAPGKMEPMLARFRDHTVKLFKKHGMKNIGYWVTTDPQMVDGKPAEPKLIYLLAHKSREAAKESWTAFAADPEWAAARAASEKDGKLAAKVEAIYLAPTDFSQMD
jgi:hypothetical protein